MKGRTFLVLGGTSGIGLGITKQLLLHEANVIAASKYRSEYDALDEDLRNSITYHEVDITQQESRAELIQNLKETSIDGIITSIGILTFGPFAKTPPERTDRTIETNYKGIVLFHAEILPTILPNTKDPFYLTYISSATVDKPMPYFGIYPSTKAATEVFFMTLKDELPKNVRVLAIRPSSVHTNLYANAYQAPGADVKLLEKKTEGTFSFPDYIGKAVVSKMERKKQGVHHPDLKTSLLTGLLKVPALGTLLTKYYLKMIKEAAGDV